MNKSKLTYLMRFCVSISFCFISILSVFCISFVRVKAAASQAEYEMTTYVSPTLSTAEGMAEVGSRWIYEYSTGTNTDFAEMIEENSPEGAGNGTVLYIGEKLLYMDQYLVQAHVEAYYGNLTLMPFSFGSTEYNVVQTFVAPEDGKLTVNPTTVLRNFGTANDSDANVQIAIFLNNTKIWPTESLWKTVEGSKSNQLAIDAIEDVVVNSGDKLRFVVNHGTNAHWSDWVQWPVTIDFKTEKVSLTYSKTSYESPCAPTVAGMEEVDTRWIYEYSTGTNADFAEMIPENSPEGAVDGTVLYTGEKVLYMDQYLVQAHVEAFYNSLTLMPFSFGSTEYNAVQTFVVPEDGKLDINPTTVLRNFGRANDSDANVQIAIFLNNTKIWPTESLWKTVEGSKSNQLAIDAIENIAVNTGDKLRFVVNHGTNAHWSDYVQWPVTIDMFVPTNGSAKCDYVTNSTLSTDVELGDIGDTVTVTVTPVDGYQLKAGSLRYTVGGKSYPITVAGAEVNTFMLAMPAGAATIQAEFVPLTAHNMAVLGASYKGNDSRFVSRAYRKAGNASLVDSGHYVNLSLGQSKNIKVNNFKCFSSYGASDGINTKACENVRIENSFIVSNDDALSVYASSVDYLGSTRYYSAINNTLTSGIHMAIHGQEYGNDEVSKVRVEKLYILINATQVSNEIYQGLLSVNAGNDVAAYDITFDTVFIENIQNNQLFNVRVFMNPNYNKTPGRIVENIRYKNIYYEGNETTVMPAVISGNSADRCVKNVVFENVQLNKVRLNENDLIVGQYVQEVLIK